MTIATPTTRSQSGDRLIRGDHAVQFYAHETQLISRVTLFFAPAFQSNQAVILVATKSHRESIEAELRDRGIDLEAARSEGRFVSLDAAETLASLSISGHPDHDRFNAVIRAAVLAAQSSSSAPHVRVYGEMVALLWRAGKFEDALLLEKYWNELRATCSFTLLCGYPSEMFAGTHSDVLAGVASAHTHVMPNRGFSGAQKLELTR